MAFSPVRRGYNFFKINIVHISLFISKVKNISLLISKVKTNISLFRKLKIYFFISEVKKYISLFQKIKNLFQMFENLFLFLFQKRKIKSKNILISSCCYLLCPGKVGVVGRLHFCPPSQLAVISTFKTLTSPCEESSKSSPPSSYEFKILHYIFQIKLNYLL